MSYLSSPRLHFSGHFQADVSTVNNDVRHFDSTKFLPKYQLPQEQGAMNGWWNPEGTGAFRLVSCSVTGGVLDDQILRTVADDPVIGMTLAGADGRVCGKLVDLDPQQQSVSEIWGLQVRLTDKDNHALLRSEYKVAPFIDLWRRQHGSSQGDQTLASAYQSILQNVAWDDAEISPLLMAIRQASDSGLLSIRFNVFGYKMDSTAPDFTLGHIAGTIGPASNAEPSHFVLGRQMAPELDSPIQPKNGIYFFQCQVDAINRSLSADLGNCLPITDGVGSLMDLGKLALGVLKIDQVSADSTVGVGDVAILGELAYQQEGWYKHTAGVQSFDFSQDRWIQDNIHKRPIVLLRKVSGDVAQILVQETADGLYVRADQFVRRLNPGESASVDLYATQFGAPLGRRIISVVADNSMIGGGSGPSPLDPPVKVPDVGVPAEAISYPPQIKTEDNGMARLRISAAAAGPGNPRGYIDGQLYGLGYKLQSQPNPYNTNPWNFISVLVWDNYVMPEHLTWYEHIQPVLKQYGNLYPIMSKHLVDLGNYESVVQHLGILKLAFSLPVEDPNYMPVTRDLSAAKSNMILKWISALDAQGQPAKGSPQEVPVSTARAGIMAQAVVPTLDHDVARLGGKTAFIYQIQAKNKR